jgi:RNA polymerase sigma-70 factor (ECF subfamily)
MTVPAQEVAHEPGKPPRPGRDVQYEQAVAVHAAALGRLARAYEADAERCRDLLQEIHIALWESLAGFDGRCSLRTWVYRVAHNVACSHVLSARRKQAGNMVSLDELANAPTMVDEEANADRRLALDRLLRLIHRLAPLERQVILLYLESMDAASIAEITGLSAANVSVKIHRIKKILADRFREGGA